MPAPDIDHFLGLLSRHAASEQVLIADLSPVIGAHLGPRTISVASLVGHCPPLLVPVDGVPVFLADAGPQPDVTGERNSPPIAECAVPVPPGSTIVVFTAGIIGGGDRQGALERLRLAAMGAPAELGDFCDHLVRSTGSGRRDRGSLLAIRVDPCVHALSNSR